MARMVATKAALSIRVDALTDVDGKSEPTAPSIGIENRAKLESRLRALEHQSDMGSMRSPTKRQQKAELSGETKVYNTAADNVGLLPTERDAAQTAVQAVLDVREEKRKAKAEKKDKKNKDKQKSEELNGDHIPPSDDPMEQAKSVVFTISITKD
jgi:nucleolar protein 58